MSKIVFNKAFSNALKNKGSKKELDFIKSNEVLESEFNNNIEARDFFIKVVESEDSAVKSLKEAIAADLDNGIPLSLETMYLASKGLLERKAQEETTDKKIEELKNKNFQLDEEDKSENEDDKGENVEDECQNGEDVVMTSYPKDKKYIFQVDMKSEEIEKNNEWIEDIKSTIEKATERKEILKIKSKILVEWRTNFCSPEQKDDLLDLLASQEDVIKEIEKDKKREKEKDKEKVIVSGKMIAAGLCFGFAAGAALMWWLKEKEIDDNTVSVIVELPE